MEAQIGGAVVQYRFIAIEKKHLNLQIEPTNSKNLLHFGFLYFNKTSFVRISLQMLAVVI